ncbi:MULTISPECIES: Rrf2 family transcriptional regulator [unclassified Variovorax]|uniref:Rrf2 family transcriptional regulator n=1 Tax=unclassified Variovorax TaxID=663243 RepID=UPI00076DC5DF|nr:MULTISPECIES: Rrf2 family transcriptional regulator [unclassified Variovorax]KWT96806.1 Nitrite-sensitive transcriptional repressor NsrR [Variovorax sp. WDL1]PNG47211.1 HTH-type transcriptional repressor NsrR [Variovorax sp. B2]PNG48138.1 HTH-type transcriptional repressor NsrR [Variovorax sp. B4]VTV15094.1 HTH-type transcriptional repressor NsrR [Variovorax sp. WDL1]
MKLTAFTDYSLRVLIYLATQPDRRATIAEIASSFGVSEHHLTKVVHFLGKQGWLANVRGKGGGLSLAKVPDAIDIGDVVRHTEAGTIVECFGEGGGECRIAGVCCLRGVLDEAVAAFHAVLHRYTLADLVRNREALSAVLFVDGAPARHHPARERK